MNRTNFEHVGYAALMQLVIGLVTGADNAAAVSGGLIAGDMYKTSTDEVRIVV